MSLVSKIGTAAFASGVVLFFSSAGYAIYEQKTRRELSEEAKMVNVIEKIIPSLPPFTNLPPHQNVDETGRAYVGALRALEEELLVSNVRTELADYRTSTNRQENATRLASGSLWLIFLGMLTYKKR